MGLFSPNEKAGQIFDEVRHIWVAKTPEEEVRQQILHKMLYQLHYPKELLAVEKSLKELTSSAFLPSRRIDIVCFFKKKGGLVPLLAVECKEHGKQTQEALEQIQGYNHHLKAPFIAIFYAGGELFGYPTQEGLAFLPYLPTYATLVEEASRV